MNVSQEVWEEKMNNLNERRKNEVIKNAIPGIDDYKSHINKVSIGKSVLDVGCGLMIIKGCLESVISYTGIDAFPMTEDAIKMEIENCTFLDSSFDTLFCFAALDNFMDFKKAISQMKRVCNKNILFLTGVNIPPDKYHTFEVKESDLINEMLPFKVGHMEYLHEKILLIEFLKK